MEHVDPAIYFALTETHAALILEEEELLATGGSSLPVETHDLHREVETLVKTFIFESSLYSVFLCVYVTYYVHNLMLWGVFIPWHRLVKILIYLC